MCPAGRLVASSNPVTPQAWAICLAASGTTLATTTNHELSLSGNKWSEVSTGSRRSEKRGKIAELEDLGASP